MSTWSIRKKIVLPLLLLSALVLFFFLIVLRSGPLAPVAVTVVTVEDKSLQPALFGIGTVEARYRYPIGPVQAGRLEQLSVQVGDLVKAGQELGRMDPVDLHARIRAQEAALQRARALLAEAQARRDHAAGEADRYEQLLRTHAASAETAASRLHESRLAEAGLAASREELVRLQAEGEALEALRENLRLLAPVDGLVVSRNREPGATVPAGQSVVELIDPSALWVHVRFDQLQAQGLAAGLPARIALRSRPGETLSGTVLRLEPLADAVTEEMLAKVVFAEPPVPLPPLGELAEVTVSLPPLPAAPVIPNGAIHWHNGQTGVWRLKGDGLEFVPLQAGMADGQGLMTAAPGLAAGERLVHHSQKPLGPRSRIRAVESLPGVRP